MKKWLSGLLVVWFTLSVVTGFAGLLALSSRPVFAVACTSSQLPTAIGCIDTSNPNDFIKQILGLAVGIGGGIAFLLMLFGSFQIMASGGDPKGIQGGKETITSALTGLLLIVFSVFLLKLIGVDILGIPGLSSTP